MYLILILMDDTGASKQSYLEDERNGKKSYMVGAKDLTIAFGNDSRNWEWRFEDDSRYESALLL